MKQQLIVEGKMGGKQIVLSATVKLSKSVGEGQEEMMQSKYERWLGVSKIRIEILIVWLFKSTIKYTQNSDIQKEQQLTHNQKTKCPWLS